MNIRHRGDCRCDVCVKKYKFAPSLHNLTKNSLNKSIISDNGDNLGNENDSNSIHHHDLVCIFFNLKIRKKKTNILFN